MLNSVRPNSHSGANGASSAVAREGEKMLAVGVLIQFLGASSAALGLGIHYFDADYSVRTHGLGSFIVVSLPILIAAVVFILSMLVGALLFLTEFRIETRKVLWYIYGPFILLDTILLGWLVSMTGGTSNSVFTPIFLLIPAVTSCFCTPRRPWFWLATFLVMGTYAYVSFASGEHSVLKDTIKEYHRTNDLEAPVFSSEWDKRGLFVFTMLCIVTAALCYWGTSFVRKKHCQQEWPEKCPKECHERCNPQYRDVCRYGGKDFSGPCDVLYL